MDRIKLVVRAVVWPPLRQWTLLRRVLMPLWDNGRNVSAKNIVLDYATSSSNKNQDWSINYVKYGAFKRTGEITS